MDCYPCLQAGITQEAAGLCRHCSAGLCADHICAVEDSITLNHPFATSSVLPKKARILLCSTCKAALEQPLAEGEAFASHFRL